MFSDALHQARLLNVEERPFKRITKRVLAPNSIISPLPRQAPTPPPDGTTEDKRTTSGEKAEEEYRQFKEDVSLDFAAFESSIVRIQFLLNSNAQERERYAAEKLRIQATAQEVRENTAELHKQLQEAQKTLALRKTYDELAEKITNNRLLRPREDQHANLEKLNHEIAELERESRDYAETWTERREQFGKIIEEGMNLRRLIRDEKEEVERREGMEEREDGDDGEAGFARGRASGVGTPRPEAGETTPSHPAFDGDSSSLTVDKFLQPRNRSPLRNHTPGTEAATPKIEESEDINMAEDGEISGDEGLATSSDGLVNEDKEAETETPGNEQMDTS